MENSNEVKLSATFVVVGGGIAGVSCAEEISIHCPDESIILLSESTLVKTVTNLQPLTKCLNKFDVKEQDANSAPSLLRISTIVDTLKSIDSKANQILTIGNRRISYKYLCICTGGTPKLIENNDDRVIGIRDTDSVLDFQRRIKTSRKIVLVGNGGIASELAYEVKHIEIHWVIKDNYISSTFMDPGAAHFFQQSIAQPHDKPPVPEPIKRMRFSETALDKDSKVSKRGAALGPDWHKSFDISGTIKGATAPKMYYNAEVKKIVHKTNKQEEFPLHVLLTTGEQIDCDFLVSATGVLPRMNFSCDRCISLSNDGFILINNMMETNVTNIYAAGDICSASWKYAENWFQMRLWTQARQMGAMAGRSMVAALKKETIYQDFCFELFGHVTNLFGFQVILLGCYNGQGLGNNYEILLRSTPGKEYIKFVICEGKLRGAILIGNTELAETCENLILNGLDITAFGDDILNPDIDIEDYFD